MNILFLTIGKMNNINDRGIYTDLLREFRDNNHNVFVVSPLEKRYNLETQYIKQDGVSFLKVKIGNITKTNLIEKGISTIQIENSFLKAIHNHFDKIKFDLVLYSTPPITFGKVVNYIKKRDGAKSYLLLKDIFPQNAVDLNMFSKFNPIYWYFRRKEISLYKYSDFIGCMSPANVEYVLANNPHVKKEIVEVCPNSIQPADVRKNLKLNYQMRQKYGIPIDKTVFIYGGNLGKPQGVDFLIEFLKSYQSNNSFFVIVGSGTEFNKIEKFFNDYKPSNSKLMNFISKDEYDLFVRSCDVGLIFLDNRFNIPNFPSRILSYMEASMPVLAATDKNSDIGKIIQEGEFGYWCESNNVHEFKNLVERMNSSEDRIEMGKNARKYLLDNYTVDKSYQIIMKHFKNNETGRNNV